MVDSKIEWTERSDWNPVRGCTRVSRGCGGPGPHGGCYAEAIAARFSDAGQAFHGYATRTDAGGRWTGRVELLHERLPLPLSWRKPALIFANSTSDFFHSSLQLLDIAQIFGVAIAAYHLRGHRTQILTKRHERMANLLNTDLFWEIANTEASMHVTALVDPLDRRSDDARATLENYGPDNPPPGIWLGVSVEDQPCADVRRLALREVPARVKFVSYEPALGPVDWTGWEFVRQIISGGESGPRARPSHPDWHRATRDFCGANGIAYFFKQWGEWKPGFIGGSPKRYAAHWSDSWAGSRWAFFDEQPRYFSIFGADALLCLVGRKVAGRRLDGVEHSEMPA